jgi:hypothetical protein
MLQKNKEYGEENKTVHMEATSQIAGEDQYFKIYFLFISS